jgi:hypothetical protein
MSVADQVAKLFSTMISTGTSTIRDQIRSKRREEITQWDETVKDSREFCRLLGLSDPDLEDLDDLDSGICVPTNYGYVWLLPKNTCGAPYGATWTLLLQARPAYREIVGVGGGTTFIATLESYEREEVLEAIRKGQAYVEKTDLHA